ncbi:MAG: cyclic nucleotide-binding domain-containing protein, partial [Chloroflexota bacterium]
INYASVEFLLYANFFTANRTRTRLITSTNGQAARLRSLLKETVTGPTEPELFADYPWLPRECEAVGMFPPLGRPPDADDLAEVVSLESGGGELGGGARVRLENDQFVFEENGAPVAAVPTAITGVPTPLTLAPPLPLLQQDITLQFIGGSDGFDPAGITTCFLAYFGGAGNNKPTLFDTAAYLRLRLGNLGISPRQISEVVLSHLHEDHLGGLPELVLMGEQRVRLLTSDIIYASLLRVLSAMLAVTEEEAAQLFDFYPLNPGRPLELDGRKFEAIYATHTLPTIAVRVHGLCYSGDMRYDEAWFKKLEADGIITAERHAQLINFANNAVALVQDVGGGAVHTSLTAETLSALAAKTQHLVLAHTSKHALPADRPDLADKIHFANSGGVMGMGDSTPTALVDSARVETLSACPLFARLPIEDRIALANQAILTNWEAGQVIVREGDPSDGQTYIVHSGLVEIQGRDNSVLVIARGTSVGERGALQGGARSGTMIARSAVQLLGLTADVFRPVAIRMGLQSAFSRADWLWHNPTFGHLAWSTMLDLALDFEPVHLKAGQRLFAFDDAGDECYLLVSGRVELKAGNEESIGELMTVGEFFGGRAALFGTKRNASAYATEPSEVWALSQTSLQRLQVVYPNLVLHLRAIELARMGQGPVISVGAPPDLGG